VPTLPALEQCSGGRGGEGVQHLQQGTGALGDEGLDGDPVPGGQAGQGAAPIGRVLVPLDEPGPTGPPTSSLAVDSMQGWAAA
jgi:hypothetical protein